MLYYRGINKNNNYYLQSGKKTFKLSTDLTATIFPNDIGMPRNCAMNIAATASYNAVPSMLIVAPIGNMNRDTTLLTLFFSSKH